MYTVPTYELDRAASIGRGIREVNPPTPCIYWGWKVMGLTKYTL
jgi:hypothetical protein